MSKKDYKMFVDDSGYSYTEIGDDGKEYEVPHVTRAGIYSHTFTPTKEPGHHKYFVGVLIPTEKLNKVTTELLDAGKTFKSKLTNPQDIKEIHASNLYSNEDENNRLAFVSYLQQIVSISAKYKLNIVVSPKDTTIRLRQNNLRPIIKSGVNKSTNMPFLPWYSLTNTSGKSNKRATVYYQKLSLIELHNIAKMYLSDGGCVSTIMCDEGLAKKGATVQLDDNTNIMFLSSDSNPLIQFADNIAWLYNRVNVVVPDRIGRKQCGMLDTDVILLQTFSQIQNYIIKEKMPHANFQDYIFNKYAIHPIQYNSGKKLIHTEVGKIKYPIVVKDDCMM